jgi:hypothetical protein
VFALAGLQYPSTHPNICSTLDYVEGWRAEQQRQQTNAWSPGQRILNGLGARVPEHTFNQPVPHHGSDRVGR